MNHDIVPQHAHLRAALDVAFEHVATSDRADFRAAEHLADVDQPDHLLLSLGRKHAGEGGFDLLDRLVDDVVVAYIHASTLDQLARRRVGTSIEADDYRARCHREIDVRFSDAAHAGMHDVYLDFVGREARKRMRKSFLRPLDVGLEHDCKSLLLALAHLLEYVLELGRLLFRELDVPELSLTEQGDFTRLALIRHHDHFFARLRHFGQTLDFDGNRRARRLHRLAVFVQHGSDPAEHRAGKDYVATLERSGLHQQRRDGAAPPVTPGLDHDTSGRRIHRCLQLQHLGLQEYALQQVVYALPGFRRHGHERRVAPVFLRHDAVAQKFLFDFLRIGVRLVYLVYRNHKRHFACFRVVDRLDRLRHDAVICGHDENNQVGHLGSACPHGRKSFVTRSIEAGH